MADNPRNEQDATSGQGSAGGASGPQVAPAPAKDPIRKVTLSVLAVCILIFAWYVAADRVTPFTDQARVQTLVTPIVPRVSGYLTEVNVQLHSLVGSGDLMFRIDSRPYELAVSSAEANLDLAAQTVGAQTATVKTAVAQVGVARAQLDRAQRNSDRTREILAINPGALSQADKDRAETALDQAIQHLSSAESELQRAKEQLGVQGPENPQLRAALAALEQARLDLEFTSVYAPSDGAIESFNLDRGYYAQAGQALVTFVSRRDVWIEADMRENNLSRIEVGDPAEFVLDVAPGRVFKGTVRSVGFGVGPGGSVNRGGLPSVESSQGWLRDPQRFPVIVTFAAADPAGFLRAGGQVDVTVYTGKHPLLNAIAKLRLRIWSLISYVR